MKKTSLEAQVEKVFRHARQGSIDTRREYKKCMLRFVKWLETNYNMQNLRNISNRHLAEFVKDMLANGNESSYIKKNLAAIRYTHDHLPNPRYRLECSNDKLGVPDRVKPGNRAWKDYEYELLCEIAIKVGKEWIVDVLTLQRELGLRIHEVIRFDTVVVERAFRNGYLWAKGKGGKERMTIALSPASKQALLNARARVRRGAKLFVPEGQTAKKVIKDVQDFIYDNRPQRAGEQLTSHGLRYSYAQQRMAELLSNGVSQGNAEQKVSREMGHERRRVTRGYLNK